MDYTFGFYMDYTWMFMDYKYLYICIIIYYIYVYMLHMDICLNVEYHQVCIILMEAS